MPKFKNRQIAIEKTLAIEALTSKLIKHMVGLDLHGSTKALDNKSSSISLKAKIDLLSDCGKIDKQTYTNLQHIISIRNQFAHNFECDNFSDLPKFINGIEKPLIKYCDNRTESTEDNLKNGFLNMWELAFKFLGKEFEGVNDEYHFNLQNLRISISKTEEGLLNQWGITGARNRALLLTKLRELLNEEGRHEENKNIENQILDFIRNNPNFKNHS